MHCERVRAMLEVVAQMERHHAGNKHCSPATLNLTCSRIPCCCKQKK